MIRRISVWGGPGSGKSTTAAWLYAHLKIAGHKIQFIEEYVKRWAYQARPISSFDQFYLTAKQIKAEDDCLRSDLDTIITECPVGISYFFTKRNKLPYTDVIRQINRHFEDVYPSFNIFLQRHVKYQQWGRYESEEEAQKISDEMMGFLQEEYPKPNQLIVISPHDKDKLLETLHDTLSTSVSNKLE